MKSFRDMNPYAIGLGSILVIGAFTALAFAVGILKLFDKTYAMSATFSDSSGVRGGNDVRLAGVKVGRVTSVKPDRKLGKVNVGMDINQGVELGQDVQAEIALGTLLGTKYMRLTSSPAKPYMEDLPTERRTIPLERTKTPFDLFELTNAGTRAAQQTDTEKLNQLIKDLAQVTEGKHDQLADLLTGLTDVTTVIDQRETQLKELLDRLDVLSNTLDEKDQTLVGLIDQSQRILDLTIQRRADISSQLRDTDAAFGNLSGIITVQQANIDAILTTLHPTIEILERRAGTIDAALSWLGDGALGQALAGTHGPWQDLFLGTVGPNLFKVLCEAAKLKNPTSTVDCNSPQP